MTNILTGPRHPGRTLHEDLQRAGQPHRLDRLRPDHRQLRRCAPRPPGHAGAAAEEEKSSFNVKLVDAGAQKIGVIKVVRELTGLGLKEAKDVVDANGMVMENADKAKADEAKKALEAAGAKVELQ